ncbi:beta-lactamase family protein [Aggregicoccus sp. 17bor-14]|uniref:serine hydrolase domain-containing protein n=1 Tax=Myxococcaceae TaxID=31 RepID=UPI00129C142E|nr:MULTISPECIES: serine hydrolase domain-containing protein [Myxococcaceae]MBF5041808.1 beta-lactamase family protein [Simulacricoccus sp. 17bor-14]MRI87589.1 beta-lactamase family protein [Aggregicoccus sp. 17bor-14]
MSSPTLSAPGVTVALTEGGVHRVLHGDAQGIYALGTLTPTFTGALLAVLASRGELQLDTPLSALIPRGLLPDEAAGSLTLAQLATHTAGLPWLPPNLGAHRPEDPLGAFTALHFGELLRGLHPVKPPPHPYAESLVGAGILGHALGRRAGVNYAHAVRDHVCTPLGLTDTNARPTDEQQPRVRAGHDARGRPLPAWTFPALPGAGALYSSAGDLLRFLDAQLGHAPLSAALRLTHVPRARAGRRQVGLGWLIDEGPVLWRSSVLGGFSAFLGFAPQRDRGVVVLSDHGRSRIDAFLRREPLVKAGLSMLHQA